ncbi:hypothetical protein [Pseudoalteromonas marina]|uniref:Uncharacterized protein n=1 Tax=Pseudoalteromonas marina TaxID=267375 RepID=A0ABT9FHV6_9GAMM|nr:hypothetical protein [Pseudoalteromonas marina]MDP2566383.1 hypothetical protein [Pseudoalteromonas marina]
MQTIFKKVNKVTKNDKKRLKKIKQDNKKDMLDIDTASIEEVLPPKFNFKVFIITAFAFFFLGQIAI